MSDPIIELLKKIKEEKEDLSLDNIIYKKVGIMPKDIIYKIYERRSKISTAITSKLINGIKNFTGKEVLLTSVKSSNKEFLLFTNVEMTFLIGTTDYLTENYSIK